MGIFGQFKKDTSVQVTQVDNGYQSFSTPFLKVPSSNLSLPFVDSRRTRNNIVPFGDDNLYPQYLNQMYYTSPLHGSIVNYKTNAVIGGGYQYDESKLSMKDKVNLYAFGKKISIKKTLLQVTKDIILHDRTYFILSFKDGKLKNVKWIGAEKVRLNKDRSIYSVSQDWQYLNDIKTYCLYSPEIKEGECIFAHENYAVGQDVYPIPQYTSALNFAYLSGELSYFAKANIQNSIFPSFAMMFPKKPQSPEEMELVKDTTNKLKGAENAGKAVAFFANRKEDLPEMVALPTSDNTKLFTESSELNTEQICFAHTIDPILMGVRTTGSLGGGADIKQAYIIFEKNVVIPIREQIKDIFDALTKIAGIDASISISNFQIINETITEVADEGSTVTTALNSMSPLVATKVLESMTPNEIRAMAGLAPVADGNIIKSQIPQTTFE